jgi:exopolyphosphatase/guanosine-5'-triphosphate,3'-diphosphate pyrophosphatase
MARRRERPVRGAVIDIGSNALRLQIVEADGSDPVLLTRDRVPVRLGEDVFREGRIGEASIQAASAALAGFAKLCTQYGAQRVCAVATSAVREAANRNEVVERLSESAPAPVRVLSGTEEAWLLARAVEVRIDTRRGRSLLVDVGGGSVEVTLVEDGHAVAADSYPLGAVRLLEVARRESGSVEGDAFLALVSQHAGRCDYRIADRLGSQPIDRFVATGGNIEALADLEADGRERRSEAGVEVLDARVLERWMGELAALSPKERGSRFGLLPDRADVILPATVVYHHLAVLSGARRILVPRVALRDALLRDVLSGTEAEAHDDWRDQLLASARALADRFHCDPAHAECVRRHALSLFVQTTSLHGRGPREGGLLEAAALLHDAGRFIAGDRHHEHSAYLIRASELVGVAAEDRDLVALVASYHRGPRPHDGDPGYASLGAEDRARVCVLAALLRIAEGLDRQHRGAVVALEVKPGPGVVELRLTPSAPALGTPLIEVEAAHEKADLFEAVFGVPIRATR